MSCARPSCPNVVYTVDELCSECAAAERHAMYCVDFDHLARMDEHYPEHRARHDRRPKLPPRLYHMPPDTRATPYGSAALRNIITRLAERGDRNNALFAAACQAGELVAGGQLDGQYALDTLLEAAECIAPDERWKSKSTITRGFRTGMENPRVPRRAA